MKAGTLLSHFILERDMKFLTEQQVTDTSTAKLILLQQNLSYLRFFLKTTDPPSINVQEKWPRRSYACKSTVDPNCQLNRSEHKCTAYITILVLLHSHDSMSREQEVLIRTTYIIMCSIIL